MSRGGHTVTRWNRRLLIGALAILVPALAGCEAGLNAPTLEYHPASFGVSTMVDGINIDNVFVLGPEPGSTLPAGGQASLFMALQSSNSDQLTSISAPGAASSVQLLAAPITLHPNTLVDLSGPAPEVVLNGLTNPLSGGETVQLVLHFATAGSVALMVPVEPAAYEFATYSPAPTPTASASLSVSLSSHRHKAKKARAQAQAGAPADPTASASPSATP
jgi:copper(I)-binding protein